MNVTEFAEWVECVLSNGDRKQNLSSVSFKLIFCLLNFFSPVTSVEVKTKLGYTWHTGLTEAVELNPSDRRYHRFAGKKCQISCRQRTPCA